MPTTHPYTLVKRTVLATSAAMLLAASAQAYTYEIPSLYERNEGGVIYVTGGIGEGEMAELDVAKTEYSLQVYNTTKTGAYVSDVPLHVLDSKGNELLAADAGPLFMAKLPAGKYRLKAEYDGAVQTKNITVGKKGITKTQFFWNLPD